MSDSFKRRIRRGCLVHLTTFIALVVLAAVDRLRNANEEYSVYSAYLSQEILAHDSLRGAETPLQIVMVDTTEMNGTPSLWARNFASERRGFNSLHVSTRVSFIIRNLYHTRILPNLRVPKQISVVLGDQTQIREFWDSSKFDVRRNGYSTFSGVGFNPTRTQAIFYMENICPGLCGGGWYVLMEKVGGMWQVRDKYYTWVS